MSQHLVEFKAQILEPREGSFTARLVPFGQPAPYRGGEIEFRDGSLRIGEQPVPLTVDHSDRVLDRIGVMTRSFSTATAMFGEFQIADTDKGREMRELLKAGAVTDVSVGVMVDAEDDGVMFGELDHVSLVTHGRFSQGDSPAKVLAVHDAKEPEVAEMEDTATDATDMLAASLAEFKDEMVRLADEVDSLKPVSKDTLRGFSAEEVFAGMLLTGSGRKLVNNQLQDVIGDLGTGDASGLVPDEYWAGGLQHKVDRRRPLYATGGSAPFPSAGNNLLLPKVTQETLVAKRGAQKSDANSRALQVVEQSYPLQWFDGAVDVAIEIIEQSSPSVLAVIASSMLTQYATATELDATTIVEAAATATGAALTTGTYGGLVADIITTSDLIEDATGAPGDILGVTSTQWIEILSLMDGGDRRQFALINPSNADGTGSLVTRGIDVGGVFIYRAPSATVAVQYNQDSYKNAEKSPMQLAATNVAKMGRDVGIIGATVNVTWPEGVYKYSI